MSKRRAAFTLVEMLVVIGLIALLMTLLLPTIRRARRQADVTLCSNTIQQLARASLLHAQEHRGYMPLAGYVQVPGFAPGDLNGYPRMLTDAQRNRYTYAVEPFFGNYTLVPLPGALAPYMMPVKFDFTDWSKLDVQLRGRELMRHFVCAATDTWEQPQDPVTLDDAIAARQGTLVAFSFGSDSWANPWASNIDYGINEGVFGFNCNPMYGDRRLRGHLSRINRPAKVVLFTDAKPQSMLALGFFCPWICWTPSLDSAGPVTLADAYESNGKAVDRSMFDEKRHDGRLNIAFVDGHVETQPITSGELRNDYLLPE